MEFFGQVRSTISAEELQGQLSLSSLPRWCTSIYEIDAQDEQCGEMQCLWGVFRVCREIIMEGVRFSLPACPNAFVWTVTTQLNPEPGVVVLHATINRQEHDADFIESIETFIEDWRSGLQGGLTA